MASEVSGSLSSNCGALNNTTHSKYSAIEDMATEELTGESEELKLSPGMTRRVIQLKYKDRDTCSDSAVSNAQKSNGSISRLPPFHRSKTSQASADLATIRRVPNKYLRRHRHLLLGWPAPSRDDAIPILERYMKKYRLEGVCLTYVTRFAAVLRCRLRCPEISATRCLFSDVSDPNPQAAEMERSFYCITIATTRFGEHRRPSRITEEQFLWLVQYFGGLPSWYYYYQPNNFI